MAFSPTEMRVAQFFVEREGEGILAELRDLDLHDSGILDSLDMIALAVHLEKEFGAKVDLTRDETLQAFRRFDDIVRLVA